MTFATTGLTAWPQITPPAAGATVNVGIGFTGVIGELLATLAQGASVPATMPASLSLDGEPASPAATMLPFAASIPARAGAGAAGAPSLPVAPTAPTSPGGPTAATPLSPVIVPVTSSVPVAAALPAPAAQPVVPSLQASGNASVAVTPPGGEIVASTPTAPSAVLPEDVALQGTQDDGDYHSLPNTLAAQVVPNVEPMQQPVAKPAIAMVPAAVTPKISEPASREPAAIPPGASPGMQDSRALDIASQTAEPAKRGASRGGAFAPRNTALPAHVASPTFEGASDTNPATSVPPALMTEAAPARPAPAAISDSTAQHASTTPDGDEPQPSETTPRTPDAAPPPAALLVAAVPDGTTPRDRPTDITVVRGDAPPAKAGGVSGERLHLNRNTTATDTARSLPTTTASVDATPFVSTSTTPDGAIDAHPVTPAFQLPDSAQTVARPVQAVAAAVPPPVPVVPAQPGRIGHELGVEIARRVSAGGNELVVRLDPAELGRIEVRMSFDDRGGLKTVIAADSPVALDMLRRDSADLGRSLSDAGFQGAGQGLRFDGGSGDRNHGQPRSPWLTANQKPGQADDFTATPDFDQTAYRSLRTSGRYDLIA